MAKFLKGSLIVVAILDLFLIAGAALRIIMEEPGSRPLFPVPYIGSTEDDYYDDGGSYASGGGGASWTDSTAASASADTAGSAPSGNQGALVGHLKGNSWENPPEPKGGSGGDDYQRAEQVTDGRQGDLDDAKQRIKGLQ